MVTLLDFVVPYSGSFLPPLHQWGAALPLSRLSQTDSWFLLLRSLLFCHGWQPPCPAVSAVCALRRQGASPFSIFQVASIHQCFLNLLLRDSARLESFWLEISHIENFPVRQLRIALPHPVIKWQGLYVAFWKVLQLDGWTHGSHCVLKQGGDSRSPPAVVWVASVLRWSL